MHRTDLLATLWAMGTFEQERRERTIQRYVEACDCTCGMVLKTRGKSVTLGRELVRPDGETEFDPRLKLTAVGVHNDRKTLVHKLASETLTESILQETPKFSGESARRRKWKLANYPRLPPIMGISLPQNLR